MAAIVVDGVVVTAGATAFAAIIAGVVAGLKAQNDFAQKQLEIAQKKLELEHQARVQAHVEEKDGFQEEDGIIKRWRELSAEEKAGRDAEKVARQAAEAALETERRQREALEARLRAIQVNCQRGCDPNATFVLSSGNVNGNIRVIATSVEPTPGDLPQLLEEKKDL